MLSEVLEGTIDVCTGVRVSVRVFVRVRAYVCVRAHLPGLAARGDLRRCVFLYFI